MTTLNNNRKCKFDKYFTNLGYKCSWDYDNEIYWHEVYKNGVCFLQIEMVPLKQIIKDMCSVENIELDYFISGPPKTEHLYKELCDKVREFEKNKKYGNKKYENK